jgi:membrane-bound lytic murein transglycosylase D
MSLEEFRFLNPAHNKPVIKADGSETLVLPIEKVAVFERNLETHDRPLVSWQAYTVKRSDKPEKIASTHGMTLAELKEVNGLSPRKPIVAGQTVLVPLRGDIDPHLPDLPAPKLASSRAKPKRAKCYVVSNGGAKKQVPCAAPAKKKPVAAAKTPAKQQTNGSSSGASVRALTGG